MNEAVLLYTTWPDPETAQRAAQAAVEEGRAACANIFAPHRSIYRWKGAVETAEEVCVIFKCGRAHAALLRDWIEARHPYDLPAIVALEAGEASSPAYLAWLNGALQRPQADGNPAV